MSDPPLKKHDKCGSKKVKKLISATSFQLKGEGWYVTDYKKKKADDKPAEKKEDKKEKKSKKKKDKEADSNVEWKDNVWYGANGVLGLGSSNGSSRFAVGIQPMVGYKVLPWLSVGPRLGLVYQLDKQPYNQNITLSYNTWQMTAGAFTRIRFWNFFVHGEVSHDWFRQTVKEPGTGDKITTKQGEYNQYVGLGWNEGRPRAMGYELLILVNIQNAKDPNYPYVPIEFRGGLTYNF